MSFGLTNAPATFQSLMNDVFPPFLRRLVLVFFDDVLVYNRSKENLRSLLDKLYEHQLYANLKKCEFGKEEVAYFAMSSRVREFAVDQDKIKAIVEWSIPLNLCDLRRFLGLTGYYQKFVANYAPMAHPLTDKGKDHYGWLLPSFEWMKASMVEAPVLAMPDFSSRLDGNRCTRIWLGSCFDTRGSTHCVLQSCVRGSELVTNLYTRKIWRCLAVQKWKHYLLGRCFIICTYQQITLHHSTTRNQSRLPKLGKKLFGFDFDI